MGCGPPQEDFINLKGCLNLTDMGYFKMLKKMLKLNELPFTNQHSNSVDLITNPLCCYKCVIAFRTEAAILLQKCFFFF